LRELEVVAEPAGFAVHVVLDDDLISHIQPVVQLARPIRSSDDVAATNRGF
jgi:hypothetical protein